MKIKILSFLLVLALIITTISFSDINLTAGAAFPNNDHIEGETDEWFYTTNFNEFSSHGGLMVYWYKGNQKNVVIPSEINGIPVTCVDTLWTDKEMQDKFGDPWYDTSNIESVVVPDTVKVLHGSFYNLENLKSVTLPEGLERIWNRAFYGCNKLTKIDIPDSVLTVYTDVFENCGITEVEFGENIKSFDFEIFGESNIEKMTFNAPEIQLMNTHCSTVDKIICNGMVYRTNAGLIENSGVVSNSDMEIVCNGGVQSYWHKKFTKEKGLYAHYDDANETVTYKTVPVDNETEYINGDYKYYLNGNNEAVISRYLGTDSEVTVPGTIDGYTVTEIGESAFHAESEKLLFDNLITQNQISTIVLPESVNKIGPMAFSFNKSLVSVNIPDTVTELPSRAFEGCSELENIDWPENLKKIGMMAFYQCTGLSDLQVPEGVTRIGPNAFSGCENIKSVSLPETLTSIGCFAFRDNSLLESVSIPDSVTELDCGAFMNCKALKTAKLPADIEVIPEFLFRNTNLQHIDIPETVTEIGHFAFYLTNLGTVTLPENLKYIGSGAFLRARLTELNLPSSVEYVGSEAFKENNFESLVIDWQNITAIEGNTFSGCRALKKVEIKGKIKEIGSSAFSGCSALEEVVFGDNVEKIYHNAFDFDNALKTLTIPQNVDYIGPGAFEDCDNLKTVYFKASNCKTDAPSDWTVFGDSGVTGLYIGPDVETLDNNMFRLMRSLLKVDFSEGVRYVGEYVFAGCTALQSITLPDSLEYIGASAFESCLSIVEINIPANLKILGFYAFYRCTSLTTVYFNAANCKVSNYEGEIVIPEDWATASPFHETKITNIIFGENVTAISSQSDTYGTFESCETLETVSIPNTVEEIGTAAFKNCTSLETAVISDGVTEIADDAFDGCNKLTIYCSETSYAYAYASAKGISVSTFIISAIPNKTYTGYAIKPAVTVSVSNTILTKDVDYSVSYSNNINVGQATVVVQGKGDYDMLSSKANFKIVTKNISNVSIAEIKTQKYTGKAVEPSLTITDNGRYLKEGTDYKAYYYNNINLGKAYVSVTGIGNYSGSVETSFEIGELDASERITNFLIRLFEDFFAKFISFILNIGFVF